MIVGHLPHPSRLVPLLILDVPGKEMIKFTVVAVLWLNQRDDARSAELLLTAGLTQTWSHVIHGTRPHRRLAGHGPY
jgi:phosphohistidine phosphatase SixA